MAIKENFNLDWFFIKENVGIEGKDKIIEPVVIPHTWNNLDGQDGGDDYLKEKCWYRKTFKKPADLGEDEFWLEFDGVNSVAEVYLNGKLLKVHEGGYSRFRVNLTEELKEENELVVSADNRESDHVYPKFADFTFYGGIYRNVKTIRVPKSHFELDYYAAPSIAITPKRDGEVKLAVYVANPQDLKVELEISGDGALEKKIIDASEKEIIMKVQQPHLWNGRKDPYLYTLNARLMNSEKVFDEVAYQFGFRDFKVDAQTGFYLNGVSYPLRGVCRHQDRENMGNAISEKEHKEDIELIKEVGANTIRLAHYQHDQYFYDQCDEAGLVVWAEIPFISTKLQNGHDNEMSQMRELVLQNYNHPSIICWGLSNEITISSDEDKDLVNRHHELNDLCHQLDSTRLTTMAQLSALEIGSEMNRISDLRSYNIYYGWYGGEFDQNGEFMDKFHATYPDLPFGISEYGCEAILKWHNDKPEQGDYSEEYQALYHESLLKQISERPYLWATHLWNMFDFGSDMRDEGGVAGRNHKGLVTFDRKTRKDSFYIYQAYWTEEPMVHICGRRYVNRPYEKMEVKVYSNQPEVTLKVNGQTIGTLKADKIFIFKDVTLKKGENTFEASVNGASDTITLNRVEQPDPSYVYSEGGSVSNWFEADGDCFTVDDKIKDILANPQGKALFDKLIAAAGSQMQGFQLDENVMKIAGTFTVRRIIKMAGKRVPQGALEMAQQALSKIKK